jgi:hypothetical protein
MDSIAIERRIASFILDPNSECFYCLEKLDFNAGSGSPKHSVVPALGNRSATCGHVVHLSCAQRQCVHGRWEDDQYVFNCGCCRFVADRYETAYIFESKCSELDFLSPCLCPCPWWMLIFFLADDRTSIVISPPGGPAGLDETSLGPVVQPLSPNADE